MSFDCKDTRRSKKKKKKKKKKSARDVEKTKQDASE